MISLLELQSRFAAALRGESSAIATDVESNGIDAAGRLNIYRNNSRSMFEGALERTYPVLRRRVGDDFFRQLARGYRKRFPSRSGDLHWVGQHFPQYVAETQADSGYAWLAELATLEWACEASLVASREPPIGIEVLAGLGPDLIANARLRLQPSLHCIGATIPVLDVWRANQPGTDGQPVNLSRGAQHVLVSCGDDGLELREVVATDLEFARLLRDGATLGAAVDQSDLALGALPGVLGLLFRAGLVTGVLEPPAGPPE